MNKHINQLLQIQDMLFVLHKNDILLKNKDSKEAITSKLEQNIEEMLATLPINIHDEYDRISDKYDVFTIPMIDDSCTGCFMKLPIGVANNVKNSKNCINCPSCHRFLYEDFQTDRPDNNFHYKGVARFSSIDLMFPQLQSTTHAEVLQEVATLTAEKEFVENGDNFAKELLNREALASTAVGSGIAFPHARGIRACGITLAVAISKDGIDFGDGEKVHLLFVSAVPTQTSMFYMELISKIARYFGKAGNVQKMVECTTPEEMWKIFIKIGK